MKKKLILIAIVLLSLFGSHAKAQYTQIFHTSGQQQYNCHNVDVGPFWWWYYYYQNQYYNGTNYTCGVGPYSDSNYNNQQYYYGWGGYQFKFTPAVSAVRFQVADMQQYEWVEIYLNGQYYPLTNANLSAFPGTCGQSMVTNYGYLYMTTNGTGGAQIDITGTIDSVAVLTSGGYYYNNTTVHDITYSAYFLDPNYQTITPTSNNPSCGGMLNLFCNTVNGATSYSWTGPNNFSSTQQNPVVGTATYLQSGTYTVTVTTPCGTFSASVTVNIASPTPPTVNSSTINYCIGQTASILSATGTSLLWYTSQLGGTGSTTAPTPVTTTAGTFTWWVSQTVNGCESDRTPITVNVYAVPAAPIVTSNTPVCSGNSINLTVSGGGTYSWTGPNSFSSTSATPSIASAQSIHAGTYSVTTTTNGCTSSATTVAVVVNPTPVISGGVPQNPTTCSGSNGQITLSGLTANTAYTVTYNKNNVAQTPVTITTNGSGQLILTGLTAGTYSSLVVTLNGCSSSAYNTFTLTDPAAPNVMVTATNSTNCTTPNGSLIISGVTPGTYTVNYTFNGTPQTPVTSTVTGNQIYLNNMAHGSYTGITVTNTTTNCTSNIMSAVINGPVIPTIYSAITNPATCNTPTGSILLTGLTSGTSYVINYTYNGNPQTLTQTAVNGSLTVGNLTAGSYTNIYVVVNGCNSNILGPLSLVDPSSPATPVVTTNAPICEGQTLTLTASSTTNGVTYNWSGPNSFSNNTATPSIANAQAVHAGTYSVTASLNGCTSAAGNVNVVINPVPATPTGGANTPVCSGGNLNLTSNTTTTGAAYTWSGPDNFNNNTQNPTIANVTTAATGAYTVTATANGCTSLPYTFNVSVVATPVITATQTNPSTCGGTNGSITINGLVNNSSYNINYDKNGLAQAQITQIAANGSVVISGLTAATYTNITVTLNGCTSNVLGPLTLSGPMVPPTPLAAGNGPLCEGDTLLLTASTVAGATYSWSGPNSFSANTQNTSVNNVTQAAAGTYSVIASVNGCTSLPGNIIINVNQQPGTPVINGNGPLCAGEDIQLACTFPASGVTYSWSGPDNFTSMQQSPSITGAQQINSGLYTLKVTNSNGCDASSSTTVIVNPIPGAPVVTSPLSVCQHESVMLTAQGQNLRWYDQATGGIGQPSMSASTIAPVTTTYYVSQTVNGCESPRAPLVVTVNPLPSPPSATPSYNYCQFETGATQLTATGTNLQWYDVATGGTALSSAPTPNTDVPGIFKWYVTQSDANCESYRTEIIVTVNETPGLPVVEQVTYCQDQPAAPLVANGQNLLWYDAATGGVGVANAPLPNTAIVGTTDYYVSQSLNGCEGGRSLIRVTVEPKVTASLTASSLNACVGRTATVTFTGTAPNTAAYAWSFDGAIVQSGTGAGPYDLKWSTPGSKTVKVTVTNLSCAATDSVNINVEMTPVVSFVLAPDACINTPVKVKLETDPAGSGTYTWSFEDANVIEGSGAGPYTLSWNTPGVKAVSLQLTGLNCPSDMQVENIAIHHPDAEITMSGDINICSDDSVFFSAVPGLDYKYYWGPEAYFGKEKQSQSIWGIVPRTSIVKLTVMDRWGCEATDSVMVKTTPCCDVFMPNAFTPNGDGKNDVFRMVTKGNQRLSKFIIVNRWGHIVFETTNQHESWDGSYKGEAQEIGTYQYYLKYQCAEGEGMIEKKGDVTLIR